MTVLKGPRAFIHRELPSLNSPRLNLQALRTRVRANSSAWCQNTSHCLTHSTLACTAGSALWGKPIAVHATHVPDLGHTASAARDLMPCTVEGALFPRLEHGQVLVLWRLEASYRLDDA